MTLKVVVTGFKNNINAQNIKFSVGNSYYQLWLKYENHCNVYCHDCVSVELPDI